MAKGIVIIPEGSKTVNSLDVGKPNEVTNIVHYDEILEYARKKESVVLYLTSYYGLISSESVIGSDYYDLALLDKDVLMKWNLVICEEIVRACIDNGTTKVYLMCKEFYKYGKLVNEVKSRGIDLETPLMGKSWKLRNEVLKGKVD